MVNQAQQLLIHYESVVNHLLKGGWETSKAGHRAAAPEASQGAPDTPTCKIHGSKMKPSKKAGSFYCPRKEGENWCKEKVG
jgi:hypothetical protein